MRVLIIEDEEKLAQGLQDILLSAKIEADIATDGKTGLDYAEDSIYDAIILDIMLPRLDGLSLLQKYRKAGGKTPILLLTARSSVEDKVKGLDLGADYYLTKPFESRELLAALRAVARRREEILPHILKFHELELDTKRFTLAVGDKEIRLGNREYQIMEVMMTNPKQVTTKELLLTKVWGTESEAVDNNVEVYISFLRRKLRRLSSSIKIKTLRKVGYYLAKEE